MEENLAKEQFCCSYISAIAAIAKYGTYKPTPDDDSVDIGFAVKGGNGTYRSPRLEAQLKCTSQKIIDEDNLRFPLKIKNYNELRDERLHVQRVLIVVIAPNHLNDFLEQSEESLVLKHCAYWMSLRGYAETVNSSTVTVQLPRKNIFSVESLTDMMTKIGNGQFL